MDTKVIVEKALKGEDYTNDVKDFTDEQKISLNKAIVEATAKAAKDEEARLVGLRKASKAVEEQNTKKDQTFAENFARDQREAAKIKFFSSLKQTLTDKEKDEVQAEFERRGSTAYNVDMLVAEYRRAYGAIKVDTLMQGNERAVELEKNAAEFNMSMAGGAPAISQADADKYSPEAKQLFQEWRRAGFVNKTLASAQAIIDKGAKWRDRDLTQ